MRDIFPKNLYPLDRRTRIAVKIPRHSRPDAFIPFARDQQERNRLDFRDGPVCIQAFNVKPGHAAEPVHEKGGETVAGEFQQQPRVRHYRLLHTGKGAVENQGRIFIGFGCRFQCGDGPHRNPEQNDSGLIGGILVALANVVDCA